MGGVSGLSTIIYYFTGWHVGALVFIINIPIFIIGTISEGRSFLFKSLYGTIMLSLFLELLAGFSISHQDLFLSAIFGGVLSGVGVGLSLLGGGSTGGVDIIGKVLNKKWAFISIGSWILIVDGLVVLAAMAAFGELEIGLYSTVAIFISIKMIDFCTLGGSFTKTVYIITKKSADIIAGIHNVLQRGATAIPARGTYAGADETIILCTINKRQLPKLIRIAKGADAHAFIITTDSREIYGEGFSPINTPVDKFNKVL